MQRVVADVVEQLAAVAVDDPLGGPVVPDEKST